MSTPMACTVIIPAHNEVTTIGRCLDALETLADGQLTVIVACNGCTDNTEETARARPWVTVLSIPQASKVAALRAADAIAPLGSPRIYLDADVVISTDGVRGVINALSERRVLAARPRVVFDTTGASWPVTAWYRVREQLPSATQSLWGAGVYALSPRGRSRFDEFPDLTSDDLFIDSLFAEHERVIVESGSVTVCTPKRLADLMRTRRRGYRTQHEVLPGSQGVVAPGQRRQMAEIWALLRRNPSQSVYALVYASVILIARLQAKMKRESVSWERDESSRDASLMRR